jgi:hypothetical protein
MIASSSKNQFALAMSHVLCIIRIDAYYTAAIRHNQKLCLIRFPETAIKHNLILQMTWQLVGVIVKYS